MDFTSRLTELSFAQIMVRAILLSLAGIFLLIASIAFRRWYRGLYFQRLSERTFVLRSQWDDILTGKVPASSWRAKPLDCEIVESMVLDAIESSDSSLILEQLLNCLRSSGLLDMRIHQARAVSGWKQRTALVALGRTHTPEAIAPLAEALDSPEDETRIAAVRGLGLIGLPQAAVPMLDYLLQGKREIPQHVLKNALVNCCRISPRILLGYLKEATGDRRGLLARVLGELATPQLGEDLILLAIDDDPEVRASAARALGNSQPSFALPVLTVMVSDKEWFVRLRAVVALASLHHDARIRPLLHALCDSNRYVRQRAAWALAQMGSNLDSILSQVVETQDNYALQAFISELERSGEVDHLIEALQNQHDRNAARDILLQTLSATRQNIEQASKPMAASAGGR
jgi:HEAT repeat protein